MENALFPSYRTQVLLVTGLWIFILGLIIAIPLETVSVIPVEFQARGYGLVCLVVGGLMTAVGLKHMFAHILRRAAALREEPKRRQ